ncbi:AraC-like ligand-binding domain-containing protein [Leifsonia shinshuensis]|uniref:Helix-turn-helix domain-containing protein n=1 Tax=Leifsonia shinshuensis TaxID=150026 RepID=A0A7G6YAA0_9MICO|nr:helix-turn-helix domain-containing protein [Leifsonia shinshuensis]QNE35415.1 helix-turn-helix domain-containing protein [Leifsonia shinshuensis]
MFISTQGLDAASGRDTWRDLLSNAFVPMQAVLPEHETFQGEILEHSLGGTFISSVSAGAHVARRTSAHVASAENEYLKLSTPLTGMCRVEQEGKQVLLNPGDLTVYDTNRPFTLSFDGPSKMLVMMFPPQALNLSRDLLPDVLLEHYSGTTGIGTLVSPLLNNLVRHFDEIDPSSNSRLASNVLDLVAILFAERLQVPVMRSPNQTLIVRAHDLIERNLDDAELGPELVAATIHISVSYLHKLFKQDGRSVSRYILERRLERCRRDLVDPVHHMVPVGSIGARWGFPDAARFSRVFKAAYGISPRDYRLAH